MINAPTPLSFWCIDVKTPSNNLKCPIKIDKYQVRLKGWKIYRTLGGETLHETDRGSSCLCHPGPGTGVIWVSRTVQVTVSVYLSGTTTSYFLSSTSSWHPFTDDTPPVFLVVPPETLTHCKFVLEFRILVFKSSVSSSSSRVVRLPCRAIRLSTF